MVSFCKLERLHFYFENFNKGRNRLIETLSHLQSSYAPLPPPPLPLEEEPLLPAPVTPVSPQLTPTRQGSVVATSDSDSETSPLLRERRELGGLQPPTLTQDKHPSLSDQSESLAEINASAAVENENKKSALNQTQQIVNVETAEFAEKDGSHVEEQIAGNVDSVEKEALPIVEEQIAGNVAYEEKKEAPSNVDEQIAGNVASEGKKEAPSNVVEQIAGNVASVVVAASQESPHEPASNAFYLQVEEVKRSFERAANSGKSQKQYKWSTWTIVVAGLIHAVAALVATGFVLCS